MALKQYGYLETSIGFVEICADEECIISISFVQGIEHQTSLSPMIQDAIGQLKEYFEGERTVFELKLKLTGTDFQKSVWIELAKIPYGTTLNYGEIAHRIGNPKAFRAVGGANNKNKLAIVIPCHRVVGKTGAMVGYAGEIWRKESLLKLEGARVK